MTRHPGAFAVACFCLLAACSSPKLKKVERELFVDDVPAGHPAPHLYWESDGKRRVVDREILSYLGSGDGSLVYESPQPPSSSMLFVVIAGKTPAVVAISESLRQWHLDVDGVRRFNAPRQDDDGRTILDYEYIERRFIFDAAWHQPAFTDRWKDAAASGPDLASRFSTTVSLDVHGADAVHNSTLSKEVAASHLDVVDELLHAGAEVDTANDGGITPLMISTSYLPLNTAIFERLLEAGADIDARDGRGMTALMQAAQQGRKEVVKMLLARGANASLRDNMGRTALSVSSSNDPELPRLLGNDAARK